MVTVTVGLCVKNAEKTIKKATDSLVAQTLPAKDLELIVVDGNSKDNTMRIVKDSLRNARFKVRFFAERTGLGFARQLVVLEATGKYIVWVDADMVLPPDYLEKQVAFMESHPRVGIAGGRYNVHVGYGLVADLENIVYAVDSTFGLRANTSKFGVLPGAEGAIYRVEAVRQAGGFDTSINGAAEDTEMTYRVRAHGWELAVTEVRFTESTQLSWGSLWSQYVWYGRGGHFIFHKDPASLSLWKMSPLAGFVAGILRSPGAYLLTHNKAFFLLPMHYTFKRLAWFCGFCRAHFDGYGHGL
ncbi:MAG: glycosyltransferase [Candidatus Bathyarchaeota archaeon]|nr:glycosyltransferase [Candidatus Bathyarchaeota archaeon]